MEVFSYKKKRFLIEQTITNLFALFFIFISLYFIVNKIMISIMVLALLASLYTVVNNFILKVNSEVIEISDQIISFEAYNKKDIYEISKLNSFKLKEFPFSGEIYIRLVDCENKERKYWIHTSSFNEGKRLFKKLLDIEYQKHPQSLKARARSQSASNSINKKGIDEEG